MAFTPVLCPVFLVPAAVVPVTVSEAVAGMIRGELFRPCDGVPGARGFRLQLVEFVNEKFADVLRPFPELRRKLVSAYTIIP
jgi:hypothetical protein